MQVKHSEQCLAQGDGQGRSYDQEKNTGNKDMGCPPSPHAEKLGHLCELSCPL